MSERERRLADLLSGWWYKRPDETLEQHSRRIKTDPRYLELGTPIPGDEPAESPCGCGHHEDRHLHLSTTNRCTECPCQGYEP